MKPNVWRDGVTQASMTGLGHVSSNEPRAMVTGSSRPDPAGGRNARISQWLGAPDEEVMVCAFVGDHIHEEFHRQDFFFVNFAYRGGYRALSARCD